jgi:hypothetical protein
LYDEVVLALFRGILKASVELYSLDSQKNKPALKARLSLLLRHLPIIASLIEMRLCAACAKI